MAHITPDPSLVIRFDLTGRETDLVESYSLETSFLTSCDSFNATIWDPNRDNLRFLETQPVSLFLHGNKQLVGRIDKTRVGNKGTARDIQGRDYLADLVENNVDPAIKLKKDMTVGAAIELAVGPNSILNVVADADVRLRNIRTGVPVGGDVARADFQQAKIEDYKANDSEGLYAFCNRLALRQKVTIQPGADRDQLVLAAPNYAQAPAYKLVCYEDPAKGDANTIETATAERDYSKFPTHALFMGKKGNPGAARQSISAESQILADKAWSAEGTQADIDAYTDSIKGATGSGTPAKPLELSMGLTWPGSDRLLKKGRIKPTDPIESSLALYRLLSRRDEDSKDEPQLMNAMLRAIAERLKDTLLYQCVVSGHINKESGAIYSVDTLVEISDEVRDVFETLWVEAVTHSYQGESATSTLTCRRVGSYIY